MEHRTKTAQELTTNPTLRAETGETKNVQGSVARTRVETILKLPWNNARNYRFDNIKASGARAG